MGLFRIPFTLPATDTHVAPIPSAVSLVGTGGYDLTIGGLGFRLATDNQYVYTRESDRLVTQRIDTSKDPGEHALSELPWIRSQSSFHGGAGQLNLEPAIPQGDVDRVRFDMSQNCDVWTPGQVTQLPDTSWYSLPGGDTPIALLEQRSTGTPYAVVAFVKHVYHASWSGGVGSASVPPDTLNTTDLETLTALFGASPTVTVVSAVSDGTNYYLGGYSVSGGVTTNWVAKGILGDSATLDLIYSWDSTGPTVQVLGWAKARLMAAFNNGVVHELDANATGPAALPGTPRYTHPMKSAFTWRTFGESPTSVLVAGDPGTGTEIHALELDSSGTTPVLSGGQVITTLPTGEILYAMREISGSFLILSTSKGIRVCTFNTYTGKLQVGPYTTAATPEPGQIATRDRFVFAPTVQEDLRAGLVRVDASFQTDQQGRQAWAPDIRVPPSAPDLTSTSVLGVASVRTDRLFFLALSGSTYGLVFEGVGAGSVETAWLRTSRIRFDTAESKIFKSVRIRGTLDSAQIDVVTSVPFEDPVNLGAFGFTTTNDPGEIGLPAWTKEWTQFKFTLVGSTCIFNAYKVRAIPAPHRQRVIQFAVFCRLDEVDRGGMDVTDRQFPFDRLSLLESLEQSGEETVLVEFTNRGSRVTKVFVESVSFQSTRRPTLDEDFAGVIQLRLRTTEL